MESTSGRKKVKIEGERDEKRSEERGGDKEDEQDGETKMELKKGKACLISGFRLPLFHAPLQKQPGDGRSGPQSNSRVAVGGLAVKASPALDEGGGREG
jgi:hypothetical protein